MTSTTRAYLCCSIRGGRSDVVPYASLVKILAEYSQVVNPFVTDDPKDTKMEGSNLSDEEIHTRDMKMLRDCDVLVAEVTQPSFGVGYEVGRAVELKKPVLCVHRPGDQARVSAMIGWASTEPDSAPVQLRSYTSEEDLRQILKAYFSKGTLPLSRKMSLDWKSYEPM